MPTFRLTICDQQGDPIQSTYSARVSHWNSHEVYLPCTVVHAGTDAPLSFTIDTRAAPPGPGKLTIVGPPIPGIEKNNYINELSFSLESGGDLVLVVYDCPNLDITPEDVDVPLCSEVLPENTGAKPDMPVKAGTRLQARSEPLDCCGVTVRVHGPDGAPLPGYVAEFRFRGQPPLTGRRAVPATTEGRTFRLRASRTPCRLTLFAPDGEIAEERNVVLDAGATQTYIFARRV
jgi:hypothetical protein